MKNVYFFAIFLILPFFGMSQEVYKILIDNNQSLNNFNGIGANHINLPQESNTIILGGLNDLDGMGNYFNIYGSKLIIDSLDINLDGTKRVVLRREDGDDFFNLFPTINATLIPIDKLDANDLKNENNLY